MNNILEALLQEEGENYIFPFFWQHGEDEETLRNYMKVIRDCGIGAVCVESRPHPDFCGEKWWQDMDIILEEAIQLNMKVWILDDIHFPTGFANGAMKKQPDSMCRQSICCKIIEVEENDKVFLSKEELASPSQFQPTMIESFILGEQRKFEDDKLLAIIAKRDKTNECVDLTSMIMDNQLYWKAPEGRWRIFVLHLSRNFGYHRSYINMLKRDSCKILLDAVYEPHYEHYKEYFGTIIAGFFSDEPELGNGHLYAYKDAFGNENDYPWSDELEEKLLHIWGDKFSENLTFLWDNESCIKKTAKIRYTYMDAVTNLVKENFSKQIGSWCESKGIQYIGHLIEDDNHHSRTGSSLGHYFRGLYGQHMAGIDDIGGQVFPQGEDISYDNGEFGHRNGPFYHYLLGKLGSSAAAIEPHKNGNCMCEIFGNYGWEEGVRLEKYLVDHFMVRGVNCFVPHAFSPKEFPDFDCPPHFYAHGNNPQYRHFGELMKYTNRVCNLIHGGYHTVSAAILYHGESDWMGGTMTVDQVGHILYDSQLDYDVIPMDVFDEKEIYKTVIKEKYFSVNTQKYPALIIPEFPYVTKKMAEAICELDENSIPIYFVGKRPTGICDCIDEQLELKIDKIGKVVLLEDLVEIIEPYREIKLEKENDRVRCLRYIQKNQRIVYLIVNEGTESYCGKIYFEKERCGKHKAVYEYDAWKNVVYLLDFTEGFLELCVEPLQSKVILFENSLLSNNLLIRKTSYNLKQIEFSDTWKRSICRSKEYPIFVKEKEVTLPDALWEEEPVFSGFVSYKNSFIAKEGDKFFLEITDAYEGIEVFLNDISQKIQIVPPYRYELKSGIVSGNNELRIEAASTLGREMSQYPNMYGQIQKSNAKSGITGKVLLYKFDFC